MPEFEPCAVFLLEDDLDCGEAFRDLRTWSCGGEDLRDSGWCRGDEKLMWGVCELCRECGDPGTWFWRGFVVGEHCWG